MATTSVTDPIPTWVYEKLMYCLNDDGILVDSLLRAIKPYFEAHEKLRLSYDNLEYQLENYWYASHD